MLHEAMGMEPAPMLEVKTVPPKMRHALLRPRLVEAAKPVMGHGLALISAPAGYGKTTLMSQLSLSFPGKNVWYRLSEIDTNPERFLKNLIGSASRACGIRGSRSLKRLAEADDIRAEAGIILAALADEAEPDEQPLGFYFDDFQLLDNKRFADRLITQMAHCLPDNVFVVIASRRRPQIPLRRLHSLGLVKELSGNQLKFSSAEMEELITSAWGVPMEAATISTLYDLTEGWIAGAVLIIDALKTRGKLSGSLDGPLALRNIYEYLAEEVIDHQAEEMKELLIQSSLMNVVDPKIIDVVLGKDNSKNYFKRAETDNLFLERFRESETLYRFHPLFRRFLQSRLAQFEKERIRKLRLQTGNALNAAGQERQAVEQYLAGAHYEQALAVLSAIWEKMVWKAEYPVLKRWLVKLPKKTLPAALQICEAEVMIAGARYKQALAKLRRARAELAQHEMALVCRAAIDLADCYKRMGARRMAIKELKKLPFHLLPPLLGFDVTCKLAEINHEASKYKESAVYQKKAFNLLAANGLERKSGPLNMILAAAAMRRGEISRAQELLASALSHDIPASQSNLAQINFSECVLKQGNYEECLKQANEGLDWIEKRQERRILPLALDINGSALIAAGFAEEGQACLERAIVVAISGDASGTMLARVFCHLGSLERRRQDFAAACQYHEKSMRIARRWEDHYYAAAAEAALGADLLLLGNREAAAHLINSKKAASAFNFGCVLTLADLYLAWAAHLKGREKEAKCFLEQALRRVRVFQHNHVTIQECKILSPLLTLAVVNNIEVDYISWLIERIGKQALPAMASLLEHDDAAVRATAAVLIGRIGDTDGIALLRRIINDADPLARRSVRQSLRHLRSLLKAPSDVLTNREEQILGLLATGASNVNIAKQLFISEKTVKTHINKIFKKLGVTNRWEAAFFYHEDWRGENTTFQD